MGRLYGPEYYLNAALKEPVDEFLARPKKEFRGELVRIGFSCYSLGESPEIFESGVSILAQMLEWIHAGSLIVDDIQDDSLERRGYLCLHRIYGMPCALNAANWMYFEALKFVHELSVGDSTKLKILQLTHFAMADAHLGQALDLRAHMLRVPREDIFDIGMRSHELKSGALAALALQVGALLADEQVNVGKLGELGRALGASLQRFDDLGNLQLNSRNPKALEDLRLGRPSWVWMFLSHYGSQNEFIQFKDAVRALPDERALKTVLEETRLWDRALAEARRRHEEITDFFMESFPQQKGSFNDSAKGSSLAQLKNILEKVANAYA